MSIDAGIQVGVVYPQIELNGDPEAVRSLADAVEAQGYRHLVAYDHVLGADHANREPELTGPYDEDDPFHDPFVLFAYLAGRSETLEFASGILILPQRQTALVAKQAADLAVLSGDRFRMGVGVGWNPVEYDALGEDFSTRGRRADEQIGLLRRYWSERTVSFAGRFDRVDRAGILPRPLQPVPVWIGGFGDASLRRAVALGDGFIFGGPRIGVQRSWERLKDLLHEAGRPLDGFGAEYLILSNKGPGDVAAKVQQWRASGGTHAGIVTMGLGLDSTEAHIDYLGLVAAALS
ncbi:MULTISPECIES: LLM class F420-dependent oxidoreductase [Candidatus Neomicrothrix]|uniref:Putative F420-dependent oxidoreductase n=1 Tax=Candidatus Neomicrothrix parvicella RN1 TaxID=1229780 RepID=R4Z3J2_9ACTN|nr:MULTISPECIES: LLM class F420-dependent oxidoreductase [Microthrix]CCM63841.1 putative F420-dependent oxidoreductase [Candidatus Microthrix parvicella RN1]